MKKIKEIAVMQAEAELSLGERALKIGNDGKARVCARRACSFVIFYWLQNHPDFDFGKTAISLLENIRDFNSFPEDVKLAAKRLTTKVNVQFDTGYKENPIDDARIIINYFLN
jgi:hypothetical protein